MLPFPTTFASFARSPADQLREPEHDAPARDPEPTPTEAHIAWLAGAPYARVTDTDGEETRFVSLLVPLY